MVLTDDCVGLSINFMLLLFLTHVFFPRLRPSTTPFFSFSYYVPQTGLYNPGREDMKLVITWIVVFTGLRAGIMEYILTPFARRVGISKKKAMVRFAEQGWLLVYYIVFWTTGMVSSCDQSFSHRRNYSGLSMTDFVATVSILQVPVLGQSTCHVERLP